MNELKRQIEILIINYGTIFYSCIQCILTLFLIWAAINWASSKNIIEGSNIWRGYCPYEIYTVYDVETGVYYAVTEKGGITPMYTIEGEVKLVDQGNEYVIHRNLGSPHAQE